MAEPTQRVRKGTYARDWHRCVRCGRTDALSYQHRQAVGFGGSKIRPTYAEGVTACIGCNERFERDLQAEALRMGWKVRRWVRSPEQVPVKDISSGCWFVLSADEPKRRTISHAEAKRMMLAVYGKE